jgi:hypothetical protein
VCLKDNQIEKYLRVRVGDASRLGVITGKFCRKRRGITFQVQFYNDMSHPASIYISDIVPCNANFVVENHDNKLEDRDMVAYEQMTRYTAEFSVPIINVGGT